MSKKLKDNVLELLKGLNAKTLLLYVVLFLGSSLLLGTLLRYLFENVT